MTFRATRPGMARFTRRRFSCHSAAGWRPAAVRVVRPLQGRQGQRLRVVEEEPGSRAKWIWAAGIWVVGAGELAGRLADQAATRLGPAASSQSSVTASARTSC